VGAGSRVGARAQRELANLHEWVHTLEPEWWTTSVNFQRGPVWVTLRATRWRVQLSFYGTRWGWTRDSHVRYGAHISLSPADSTPQQDRVLKRTGMYADVSRILRRLGYRGEWHNKGGRFGLFGKKLRDLRSLRREVERLTPVSFKTLLAEAGRRTAR
jgi:hypothetical protein